MALFYMEQGSSKQDACLAAGITAENLAYYTRRDPVLKRKVDLAMSKGGFRASNGSFFTRKPPPGRKKNVSLSEIQRVKIHSYSCRNASSSTKKSVAAARVQKSKIFPRS